MTFLKYRQGDSLGWVDPDVTIRAFSQNVVVIRLRVEGFILVLWSCFTTSVPSATLCFIRCHAQDSCDSASLRYVTEQVFVFRFVSLRRSLMCWSSESSLHHPSIPTSERLSWWCQSAEGPMGAVRINRWGGVHVNVLISSPQSPTPYFKYVICHYSQ